MYEALSEFYDAFVDEQYYRMWKDYVCSFLGGAKSGADVGCGTGIFTVEFMRRGYDVIGVDSSRSMLDIAFNRAMREGLKPKFVCCDAKDLALPRKVDFITALNDVVNYMKEPYEFFRAAEKNLSVGGILLFDISSKYKLENVLAGNVFTDSTADATYIWQNSKPVRGKYIDMNLKFFKKEKEGNYSLSTEEQRQYIHTVSDIKNQLQHCGFSVSVYSDLTLTAPKPKSERIHFRAVKKEL